MKLITIVGARPQFIKSASVGRALRKSGHTEFIVHTGQHYDDDMSAAFFRDLQIPEPDVNLGIGSGHHGWQTGQMLIRIEEVLQAQHPDWIIVFGDTNSTLAGALAAAKLHFPVAHVESGLRSFNREMPEEHNRVLADHCCDLLFCPSQTAVHNLAGEGITSGIHLVGDVMYDSVLYNIPLAEKNSNLIKKLKLTPQNYALATVHRAENTDHHDRLRSIFEALEQISRDGLPVIVPLHPRTRRQLKDLRLIPDALQLLNPLPYLDMLLLEKEAQLILTDSGGVQKEAYWLGVPCVTLRQETEWIETVESGMNILAGSDRLRIIEAVNHAQRSSTRHDAYGHGRAAENIVQLLSPS